MDGVSDGGIEPPQSGGSTMTIETFCNLAHAWIIAGICPWCQRSFTRGVQSDNGPDPQQKRIWDAQALLDALDSSEFNVRYCVIRSIGHENTDARHLRPVLNKAMGDGSGYVRMNVPVVLSLLGEQLSSEEARELEQGLQAAPGDLAARGLLLGYYFARKYLFDAERALSQQHILWVITHAPRTELAGDPVCHLYHRWEANEYRTGKAMWLQQVKANDTDVAILANAAAFLIIDDCPEAIALYRRCEFLEPDNPSWPDRLAHCFALTMKADSVAPETCRQAAQNALVHLARVWELTPEVDQRQVLHMKTAEAALHAEEFGKARLHAEALLKLEKWGEETASRWPPMGWCEYRGKLLLGRIAVAEGDLHLASRCLVEAGEAAVRASGRFQVGMLLAAELLERGERTAPLVYLRLCAVLAHGRPAGRPVDLYG